MNQAGAVLADYSARLEALAIDLGLDFHPVTFDLVPANFMVEIAVYGLPVRMRHWSFGVRYIHQLARQHMGHSKIFEVMFPGDPCHAFMLEQNSLAENTLVTAHILGHADFAKNNQLFSRFMAMAGGQILEQSAARARRLERALSAHGQDRVDAVLDAALALETHIDVNQALHRPRYPAFLTPRAGPALNHFHDRYARLPGEHLEAPRNDPPQRTPLPPQPEYDLLWFIAHYAADLEDWERDIFLAVREEAYYFHPIHACQIMNEGWASYWHARLLREATFLPHDLYVSAIKSHSDVVRPFASGQQLALSLNPYHLGFSLWEHIIDKHGLAQARRICHEEDDFGFVRNYLDQDVADKLDLFVYATRQDGDIRIASRDIHQIREAILAPKFNYGAPCIAVSQVGADGSLALHHDYLRDGRGLDLPQAEKVMEYVARVWRRPVTLHTVDFRGVVRVLPARKF
ncbi:SpoVR family protein [Massilia antarctica]|uniref:SpoVR family protein n=1 Tax=Massilia antarctica TaxID=2765360 RepID=UPI0006BB6E00|nr:SpoVR family protein [Massilia sp. H27-R4]MCY0910146.1 SpoVR family protein [Massilia sp. H27-R4]CUI02761.1 FIG004684: SpoVR-like protein [Janthinobacterium sp. CG23_2]CUU26547.1 FIG004684: SpoVR-like protein [Janthinobacterium sp. CG23_2]